MNQITIVGLGPGAPGQITREAWDVILNTEEVWLRTSHHPVVRELPQHLKLLSFDDVYEQASTFADVYNIIVESVLKLGERPEGVVYAVPGHPLVGEATVTKILHYAVNKRLDIHIIDGLSFIEPTLAALSCDALDGLQVLDALDITSLHHPPLNPNFPALIAQVYSRAVASSLKLVLMNQYADEHPVYMVDGAGTDYEVVKSLPLYAIDRELYSPLSTLYITPTTRTSSFEGFQETVARLRSPEGCPWDRAQTHETLRMNLLEETYEVLDAIDKRDPAELLEELGDLLLQIVLQTQVAVDEGEFMMQDVIAAIDEKLKRRHPHVWNNLDVSSVNEVVTNWEKIKRQERLENGKGEKSLLDSIPQALPALTQAYAYGDRVGRIGLQLKSESQLPIDITESVLRLEKAQNSEEKLRILGKMLFTFVVWARTLDVDPESALREANKRFARNFRRLERQKLDGSLGEISDDDIYNLWA
jgi:tetrapyrrole methylase family protein/MazG family protein